MIQRLRTLPTAEQLAAMYPTPHDHSIYGRGHQERVETTIALARAALGPGSRNRVADLSCGNGAIARGVTPVEAQGNIVLGDFAAGYPICGPIEDTIGQLEHVDLFILSETLEHLDDPRSVLADIRLRADHLLLSTPLECWHDTNGEHLWAWDRDGVEEMLVDVGWRPASFMTLDTREYGEPYLYGIWVAS